MRWQDGEESSNVEDRRGQKSALPIAGGGIGIVLIAIIYSLMGGDPNKVLEAGQAMGQGQGQTQQDGSYVDDNPERTKFAKIILKDTENVWEKVFRDEVGKEYVAPQMVLFTGQTETGCGVGDAGMGPFYCPADTNVYIDLSFYDDLKTKFGAPGEFAQAYVIAHEVGHHVQNLLGTSEKVQRMRARVSETEGNQLSVRLELQADYYAGLWARNRQEMVGDLTDRDMEEALNAAHQIGDDTLQREFTGTIQPDKFTHGSAKQRMKWFKKGFEVGTLAGGDTFNTRDL